MAWLSKSMKMGKSSSTASLLKSLLCRPPRSSYSTAKRSSNSSFKETHDVVAEAEEEVEAASSGISRPLSEILKELNKRVPDSLVKVLRSENDFSIKYVPWFSLSLSPHQIFSSNFNLYFFISLFPFVFVQACYESHFEFTCSGYYSFYFNYCSFLFL